MKATLKIVAAIALGAAFVACGGDTNEAQANSTQSSEKVWRVGSEASYAPFSFINRDGVVTGYDVEVLRLISAAEPSLKFEFITAPWNALFLGLDAAKFDLLANQIVKTPEREAKYAMGAEPYFVSVSQFVVAENSQIQNIKNILGKKVGAVVGSAHTRELEAWAKKQENAPEIKYYNDLSAVLQDIANGRIDAHLGDPASMKSVVESQGLKIRVIPGRIAQEEVYFIMNKADAELAARLDAVLRALKDSGELEKLSRAYFDDDRTR